MHELPSGLDITPGREHMIFRWKKALRLNDFEVFISMIKFMVGIGIFYRPYLYSKAGIGNAIPIEIMGLFISITTNGYLVKCLMFMPPQLTTPEEQVTYGKVVTYILDSRDSRLRGA